MLRLTALFLACALVACSGDDNSSPNVPIDLDGAQPPKAGYEAGAPCSTNNDCASGLACLYPTASGCGAFQVCAPAPSASCPQPQTFCSCIADTIQACNGYATEAFDYAGPCADSGSVVPSDGGGDSTVDQSAPPVVDSSVPDAADAATE